MSRDVPLLYVVPAPGILVRMPEHAMAPVPPEGQWVPDNAYYQINIRDGALEVLPEK